MNLTQFRRSALPVAMIALGAVSTLAISGCQRGSMSETPIIGSLGAPAATIDNASTVPVRVTLWMGERAHDYAETWKNMTPRSELIPAGGRTRLSLRDYNSFIDPILRVQVETRGPSFLPSHTSWHEIVTTPSFNLRLFGRHEDLQLRSTNARLVRIPTEKVMTPTRSAIVSGEPATTDH